MRQACVVMYSMQWLPVPPYNYTVTGCVVQQHDVSVAFCHNLAAKIRSSRARVSGRRACMQVGDMGVQDTDEHPVIRGNLQGRRLLLQEGAVLEGPISNGTIVLTPGVRVSGPACFTNVCFESPAGTWTNRDSSCQCPSLEPQHHSTEWGPSCRNIF